MRRYELVGGGERPPIWRSVLIGLLGGLATLVAASFSRSSWAMEDSGVHTLLVMVAMLMALGLPVALFWRHRYPFILTIAIAATSLVFPIGNAFPFIALSSLLGRRRGPAVLATTALVGLTSTWVVIWDVLAQPLGASLIKFITTSQDVENTTNVPASPLVTVVTIVLGLGLSIGLGLLVRAQRTAKSAQVGLATERATSDRLGEEAARRQERERIAREVHDVMGHRLSLLNLHAGAMEANASDPRLQESAALVRESAGAAMDDLRSLLSVLREPLGDEPAALPLSKLREVVSESFGAGQQLNSSIFIEDADSASPTLSRAVYRIVQELLTNARKHANGLPVTLLVEGSPATGVMIDAQNPYRGGWGGAPPGSSRGLAGIDERVQLLGGHFNYGLDKGNRVFRAHVELPWQVQSG